MNITVFPSLLQGEITPPASKSVFQRLVAGAMLSTGTTRIGNPSYSDDGMAAVGMAATLGAKIEEDGPDILVRGPLNPRHGDLHAGESGLGMRLFAPLAALTGIDLTLGGQGSLLQRPHPMFGQVFPQLGVDVQSVGDFLPFKLSGKLQPGNLVVDGSYSSQFISGLLMALPCCNGNSTLRIENPVSKPYIEMTLEILEAYDIEIHRKEEWYFEIPGPQNYTELDIDTDADWSAAAFLLVAGAVAAEGKYQVNHLDTIFTQADQAISGPLLFSGTKLKNNAGDIQVVNHGIKGFNFDATDCPDLFPPLAALAAFADKESRITGIHRLAHKESNRALTLQSEFGAAGIPIEFEGDTMIIKPADVVPCTFNSHGDHRLAMAGAILGLGGAPIIIENADAVSKSYPSFYDDLADVGAQFQ
ncbi:MAG: 3-phosphoshikimate 1-carboxyvinyltransferase [Flavobacteriales bacterium]|jgi:3-phosphoshikimate 1-carboxyvinyltransferase